MPFPILPLNLFNYEKNCVIIITVYGLKKVVFPKETPFPVLPLNLFNYEKSYLKYLILSLY